MPRSRVGSGAPEAPVNSSRVGRVDFASTSRHVCQCLLVSLSTTVTRMNFLTFLSLLVFAFVVNGAEAPAELDIKTTYKPDDCPATAKTGDSIKVHYVSTALVTATNENTKLLA